jgi:hypothetical protein
VNNLNPSTEAKTTPKTKTEKKDALKALRSQVRAIAGLPETTKKAAKKALIDSNKATKKATLLALLAKGSETKWNPCRALEKVVLAVKAGATPAEIQGCPALFKLVDWTALESNVRVYAGAMKAPAEIVVAALCAKVEPAMAKEPPKAEPVQVAPPKENPIVAPKVELPKAVKAVTGNGPFSGLANPARVEKRAAVAPAKPAKPAKVA